MHKHMRDKFVTREEFDVVREEIGMRFDYLNQKTQDIAREIDEIYPDIREWISQEFDQDVEKQRELINGLMEDRLRELNLI